MKKIDYKKDKNIDIIKDWARVLSTSGGIQKIAIPNASEELSERILDELERINEKVVKGDSENNG